MCTEGSKMREIKETGTERGVVQRKFTKRLKGCNDMEHPARLSYLYRQSRERRRLTADLILTNRIIFGFSDMFACQMISS